MHSCVDVRIIPVSKQDESFFFRHVTVARDTSRVQFGIRSRIMDYPVKPVIDRSCFQFLIQVLNLPVSWYTPNYAKIFKIYCSVQGNNALESNIKIKPQF